MVPQSPAAKLDSLAMSSSWNRPQLKSGVDLQLQSAFNDGNWALVIRLAEKRLRTINDQYYEVRVDARPATPRF